MVVHDLRKASKVASGQKIVSLGADNTDIEKRVSSIEYKLDTLITLLNKEANNDKTRLKPIQGNDSGI